LDSAEDCFNAGYAYVNEQGVEMDLAKAAVFMRKAVVIDANYVEPQKALRASW
jgi:TPR repeat protein